MYNKILIPVDFAQSEHTVELIEKAGELVGEHSGGEEIILLHVVEEVPDYIMNFLPDEFKEDKVAEAEKELKLILSKSNIQNDIVRTEVRKGNSYVSIIESSNENDVDLILINSHKPGFEDYLLGSTAAKVVRHAKCAVLVER